MKEYRGITNCYNRRALADKGYTEVLVREGQGLQGSEINEIQSIQAAALRGVADALLHDGDIVADASVALDSATGTARCAAGRIYLKGAVREVPAAVLTVPVTGNAAENLTLAINDGEPKPVLFQGVAPEVGDLARGQIYTLKYSGSAWQIMAGMARDRIGQTVWFEDTLQRPGYVPLNGCTIENFSQHWPQMAAYLATAHGQERCFATLAEREAAHVAVWHTLASGEMVNWNGFGGVCKFFYDAENDILYLPDLRGMFRSVAGDGVVAPSMGEAKGDTGREISGSWYGADRYPIWGTDTATGIIVRGSGRGKTFPGSAATPDAAPLSILGSRVYPAGATFAPRSWGALASVYLGHPATA